MIDTPDGKDQLLLPLKAWETFTRNALSQALVPRTESQASEQVSTHSLPGVRLGRSKEQVRRKPGRGSPLLLSPLYQINVIITSIS